MVEQARNLLRQAVRVDEAKRIHDQATAVKVYLRASKAAKAAIDDAGEIQVFAARRMGELLKEQKKTGKRARRGQRKQMSRAGTSEPATLSEMGLTRNQAARAQQLANIPEDTVRAYVEERRADAARSVSVNGLVAAADDAEIEATPDPPDPVDDVVELYLALSYADRARFQERIAKEAAA
jgi:hypothetical protein